MVVTANTPVSGVPGPPVEGVSPQIPAAPPAASPSVDSTPAASTGAPASSGPDLSGVQSRYDEAQQDFQKAQKIMQQPTTEPPPPHARLLAMVEGLATGLSAFGKSIATKGKEGGAPEVEQHYAQQAEIKMAQ